MTGPGDPVRIDRWLWAVRAVKTRAAAHQACTAGRVRVNGEIAKPATRLRIGDRVEARLRHRTVDYEVVQTIGKRVGAPAAARAFVDHTPAQPEPVPDAVVATAQRDRGTGRPTKRDRRQLDRFRGR